MLECKENWIQLKIVTILKHVCVVGIQEVKEMEHKEYSKWGMRSFYTDLKGSENMGIKRSKTNRQKILYLYIEFKL